MASNDTTITYKLLTPQDELNTVSNSLRSIEQQHYQLTISRLGLPVDDNGPGSAQLATLVSQVGALQAEYDRVKGLVDAQEPAPEAPASS